MPDIFSIAMGNDMLTARFCNIEECFEFINFYLKKY